MVYPDPFMWAMPVIAGLLCGLVKGLSIESSNPMGSARRFPSAYGAVPVTSALLTIAGLVAIGVVDFAPGSSGLDLKVFPIVFVLIIGFALFTGVLIGIPLAMVSCRLISELRRRSKAEREVDSKRLTCRESMPLSQTGRS